MLVSSSYIPGPPSDQHVTIPRDGLRLLALVDISTAGRRVLDELFYYSNPETGVAQVSQNELCVVLGASKPTVNRGFKELRECGLAWSLADSLYQLHPVLTGGKVSSPVMEIPEIKAANAAGFTEQRRVRFAAQLSNLDPTG